MRVLKPVIGFVLVLSLLLNTILLIKYRGRRPILVVNGVPISRSDMDNYLEQQWGAQYKATIVQRLLLDQEAHASACAPTDQEVDEEFNLRKDTNWVFAQRIDSAPWLVDEAKSEIKQGMESDQLQARDIHVTDEEIKAEYDTNPALYDIPNKALCQVAVVLNDARAEDVRKMMAMNEPPISPSQIKLNFPREVVFLGGDSNSFTFLQAFGTSENKDIFSMDVKSVKVTGPGELVNQGARKLVIRLNGLIPGHKADLNDPKIRKKVILHVALRRAKPLAELMSSLWTKANLVFEDPTDRSNIERIFFPERSGTK